ncbi:hypothetical protein OG455_27895 [Kitasatospora sp. NBC_01287]|uniref:hypothetical protein n=1 Tax=Kitasatospora sp. NBC_01287 TaxID=2903573 RepID=UPI0022522F60|nr:hypothetical protein [Kitasatospora sp. NBC_01287]MCX4749285.1 hypothetical protein [Kitasatospora sp. NBC_01287]
MPIEIDLTGLPLDLVPVIIARTRRELEQAAPAVPGALGRDATRVYTRHTGPGWAFVRWANLHHNGHTIHNTRHILTSDPHHTWWSLPIHPRSPFFQFNPDTGHPIDGSARPYPHPVTADNTDPLGLCQHCGSRGRFPVRCTTADPDRHHEQHRYPNGRPWKYLTCPTQCQPITDPVRLHTPTLEQQP